MSTLRVIASTACLVVWSYILQASPNYLLTFSAAQPEIVTIQATLALSQSGLHMSGGGIPQDIPRGWADFVTIQTVRSATGKPIDFVWRQSNGGWGLHTTPNQQITVEYQVRLAHHLYDWSQVGGNDARPALLPGPSVLWVTRGLFILPDGIDYHIRSSDTVDVTFNLPADWKVSTAWTRHPLKPDTYQVLGFSSLTNNLLMAGEHVEQKTSFDNMSITWAMVPGLEHRADLFKNTLEAVLPVYKDIFGELPEANYLICASLNNFEDGEAFQNSFHQMFTDRDLDKRKVVWANVLAHEMFHYWNGTFFLRASDFQGNYWFSEGFTEYYSNLALIRGGIVPASEFYQKLAFQFSRYFNARFLTDSQASLVQAGYQKAKHWGLLYGGGASTAFVLDVMIRSETENGASLDSLMKLLYQQYGKKGLALKQEDIIKSLRLITGSSYQAFFDKYINGKQVIPLLETCATAGLTVAFYQGEFYLKPSEQTDTLIRAMVASKETGME